MLTLKRKPSAKFKTLTVLVTVLIFASCMFASAGEDSRQASVLDLFPSSGIPSGKGEASCSFDYVASGSTWNPKVDEKAVFLASFKGEGWQLGVGKGGTSTRSVVLTENPSHPNAYPLRGMMKSGRQW